MLFGFWGMGMKVRAFFKLKFPNSSRLFLMTILKENPLFNLVKFLNQRHERFFLKRIDSNKLLI